MLVYLKKAFKYILLTLLVLVVINTLSWIYGYYSPDEDLRKQTRMDLHRLSMRMTDGFDEYTEFRLSLPKRCQKKPEGEHTDINCFPTLTQKEITTSLPKLLNAINIFESQDEYNVTLDFILYSDLEEFYSNINSAETQQELRAFLERRDTPRAQSLLGKIYYEGIGIDKDTQKGEELMDMAASQGLHETYRTIREYVGWNILVSPKEDHLKTNFTKLPISSEDIALEEERVKDTIHFAEKFAIAGSYDHCILLIGYYLSSPVFYDVDKAEQWVNQCDKSLRKSLKVSFETAIVNEGTDSDVDEFTAEMRERVDRNRPFKTYKEQQDHYWQKLNKDALTDIDSCEELSDYYLNSPYDFNVEKSNKWSRHCLELLGSPDGHIPKIKKPRLQPFSKDGITIAIEKVCRIKAFKQRIEDSKHFTDYASVPKFYKLSEEDAKYSVSLYKFMDACEKDTQAEQCTDEDNQLKEEK